MHHLAVAGGRVDNGSPPCHNAHMAADHDNVSGLEIVKAGNLCVFSHAPPAGRGDIALTHACLV